MPPVRRSKSQSPTSPRQSRRLAGLEPELSEAAASLALGPDSGQAPTPGPAPVRARPLSGGAEPASREHPYGRASNRARRTATGPRTAPKRQRPDFETELSVKSDTWVGAINQYTGRNTEPTRAAKVGDIIRIPHYVPSLNEDADLKDHNTTWADTTGPIIAKMRPAIVVGNYKYTYVLLPIWTSASRGSHDREKEHTMHLREWDDNKSFWSSKHEIEYLMIDPTSKPVFANKEGAHINLTFIGYIPKAVFKFSWMGRLTPASTARLIQRLKISIHVGNQPLESQETYRMRQLTALRQPGAGEFKLVHDTEVARRAPRPPIPPSRLGAWGNGPPQSSGASTGSRRTSDNDWIPVTRADRGSRRWTTSAPNRRTHGS